jgi:hypothetical protein
MFLGKRTDVPKAGLKKKHREETDRRGKGLKECEIQKGCEDLLNNLQLQYIRIPDSLYSYIFSPASKMPVHLKKLISSFIKGVPDLVILLRDGRYICAELKTASGKLSQGQKTFQKAVGEKNYHVVRSVEGLMELLQEYNVL